MKISNFIVDLCDYKKKKSIGKGYSGEAFLIEHIDTKINYVAKIANNLCTEPQDQKNFMKEISIHLKCHYPTIVPVIGYNFLNFEFLPHPTIITKYISNGSLRDILVKERNGFAPKEWTMTSKYIVLLGTAFGMKYIHSQNVTHLDLKPGNILLDENFYPNICDFGFSEETDQGNENSIVLYKMLGTCLYMAPEIEEGRLYNHKVDIFSFSIIVYELITGVKRPIDMTLIEGEVNRNFLTKCISKDPSERPSFYEISKFLVGKSFVNMFGDIDYHKINQFFLLFEDIDADVVYFHGLMLWDNKFERESIQYFIKASQKGNVDAMLKYAEILEEGLFVEKNKEKASFLYKNASDKGSVLAMLKYGKILYDTENKEEAAFYYKKAADLNNLEAMLKYADMLYEGDGIQMNKIIASFYYRNASDLGSDVAMFKYAKMLDIGDIRINKKEALKYYKQSADKGNLDAKFHYAKMLDEGIGVEIDKQLAAVYYQKAAKEKHIDSMFSYGLMLFKGDGIPINKKSSFDYFLEAANQNKVEAMLYAAEMLDEGEIVEKDKKSALNLYKKSANMGNVEGMFKYANMLLNGEGIEADIQKAAYYFKMAADKGHLNSMFIYSNLLYNGNGIQINKEESLHYCRMALDNGKNDVRPFFVKLLREFEDEIIDAEKEKNLLIISPNYITYKLLERSQTAIIVNSPKASGDVFIPASIKYKSIDYLITRIDKNAFANTSIKSLSFADESFLMEIEKCAFDKSEISILYIPKSLQKLKYYWNYNATHLNQIEVDKKNDFYSNENGFLMYKSKEILFAPLECQGTISILNKITSIGSSSFYKRNKISSLNIKSHVLNHIEPYSFYECSNLEKVTIESHSELRIHHKSFSNSRKLSSLIINCENVYISNNSFENCISLESIKFINNKKNKFGTNVFKGCSSLSKFELHFLKEINIGNNCFENAKNLKSIDLIADLITLGNNLFKNCPSLSFITINSKSDIIINSNSFNGCDNIKQLSLMTTSKLELCSNCFKDKKQLQFAQLSADKFVMNEKCFSNCSSLETIIISCNKDIVLSTNNFGNCVSLKTIKVFSDSSLKLMSHFLNSFVNLNKVCLTSKKCVIDAGCFKDCSSLKKLSIKESEVVQIGSDQFIQCLQLSKIKITATSHVEFGQNCFSGAVNLEEIIFNRGNVKISNKCLMKCSSLKYLSFFDAEKVTIDSNNSINLKSINDVHIFTIASIEMISGCFDGALNLKEVYLSGKSVIVGNSCFLNCSSLKEFLIMDSGDVILGDKQFNKCCNLNSVTIQSIIENETKTPTQVEFGQNCFSGATNLKKIFIEGGNIKINKQCFNGCQSLASLSFYKIESLSIGNKEFQNFRSLTSLEIDAKSNISLGSYCFSGSKNLQSVKIHGCGSVSLGYSCFYDCNSLLKVEFSQIHRLTLDKYAFYHCNSLGELTFDDVLRINIDDYGFNGTKIVDLKMTRAENIIIGKECFKGCSSISSFLICDADDVKI